jgi:hypothetical protein
LRTRRRLTVPFVISLFAGTAITALTEGCFVAQNFGRRNFMFAQIPDPQQVKSDPMELFLLAAGTLICVSLFSLAFVWNMRSIGIRAGRLKPIWMPGRAANARTARRDQTLHRNSGGQRRELHRRGR